MLHFQPYRRRHTLVHDTPLPREVVSFDAYEVCVPTQEVFKHGLRVKLPPQAFQVLRMLLERRGKLVSREELRQSLWPADTFVDFNQGLNNAINKIRDALNDSAEIPKYIETLPRLGYRFIGQTNETSAINAAMPGTTDAQTFRSVIGKLEIPTGQSATARPRPSKETEDLQLGGRNSKFLLVTLALLMVATAFLAGVRWSVVPSRVTQFEVNPPSKTYFNFSGLSGPPALSPDGSRFAFVAFSQGRSSSLGLWLRSLDSSDARLLPGTEGATFPFWSPDGQFVAFFGGGKLKKLDLAGGSVIPICDVIDARGGTWSTGGVILFGKRVGSLYRVEASGGKPVPLTTVDYSRHEFSHRWPQFLPDQRHFVFIAQTPETPMARLYVASLDSPEKAVLDDVTSSAMFANNHLLYVQKTACWPEPLMIVACDSLANPLCLRNTYRVIRNSTMLLSPCRARH